MEKITWENFDMDAFFRKTDRIGKILIEEGKFNEFKNPNKCLCCKN